MNKLEDNGWQPMFRPVDFSTPGYAPQGSILHPLRRSEQTIRDFLLKRGFTELSAAILGLSPLDEPGIATHLYEDCIETPCRYFSNHCIIDVHDTKFTKITESNLVEGVIADYELPLGGMMDFLEVLLVHLGVSGLCFEPVQDTDTKPSVRVLGSHAALNQWVEISRLGIVSGGQATGNLNVYNFRVDHLRLALIKFDIREATKLLGHKMDLEFVSGCPAI